MEKLVKEEIQIQLKELTEGIGSVGQTRVEF